MSHSKGGAITVAEREALVIEHTLAESVVAEPEVQIPGVLDPRVTQGAELLDACVPGWADRIDLDKFQLQSATHCVIGQLYHDEKNEPYGHWVDYEVGVANLSGFPILDGTAHARTMFEHSHGFNLPEPEPTSAGMTQQAKEWEALQQDWRIAIAARKTV